MNHLDLTQTRDQISEAILPHRVININDLVHVGEDVYNISGVDLIATEDASNVIDEIISITKPQSDKVRLASGEKGLSNFRNYLSVATGMEKSQQIAIFADPSTRTVSQIIPIKNEYITHNCFFDFIELFIDKTGYNIEKIEWNVTDKLGVIVYINKPNPAIVSLGYEEDFITDGIYFMWDGNRVEAGSYFTRIICYNGQTAIDRRFKNSFNSLGADSIQALIAAGENKAMALNSFKQFALSAKTAMESQASLREMSKAYNILSNQNVPEKLIDRYIPYQENLNHYAERSIDITIPSLVKSSSTVWELYNGLTEFATHNDLWLPQQMQRNLITNNAVALLRAKRDIQNYVNYV